MVLLTAMEYQREEGDEQKSDVQIVNSISISVMEENENLKTRLEVLAEVVSKLKAPGLKTLGRFRPFWFQSISYQLTY